MEYQCIEALEFNLKNNDVQSRCTILEGDNRKTTEILENIAEGAHLGYYQALKNHLKWL